MLWSWILSAVSLAGLWTTGNKKRYGWLISLGSEGLWFAYAVVTSQYGFMVMGVAFSVVHMRNWRKWKQDDKQSGRTGHMGFYRKTALIEAYHFPFAADVPQAFKDAVKIAGSGKPYLITLEGDSYVVDDCWIARGTYGEFWRIDNDIFGTTYDAVQPEV